WNGQLNLEDVLPLLEKMDKVGFYSIDCWGASIFESSLQNLKEDPWERLRILKSYFKKTPISALIRGRSLVGYKNYDDDLIEKFIKLSAKNGVAIFRIYDALNDIKNLNFVIKTIKNCGCLVQGTLVYTESPIHKVKNYVEMSKKLVEMGSDSICIMDETHVLTPIKTYEIISALKQEITVPINLHCHFISGLGLMNYLKAIEAGVDIVDAAFTPASFGNSQPSIESIYFAFKDTDRQPLINFDLIEEISKNLERIININGLKSGSTSNIHNKSTELNIPNQIITDLISQLKGNGEIEKLYDVLEEIPRVRAEIGYPPLITPVGEIVGTQAIINVITDERWEIIPDEMRRYLNGDYGKLPGEVIPDILIRLEEEKKSLKFDRIKSEHIDILKSSYEKGKEALAGLAKSEEDIINYCIFPSQTLNLLSHREKRPKKLFKEEEIKKASVGIDSQKVKDLIKIIEQVDLEEITIEEDGKRISIRKTQKEEIPPETLRLKEEVKKIEKEVEEEIHLIKSPVVGTFFRAPSPNEPPFVIKGQKVEKGQILCIIEAMKMMNKIESDVDGIIKEVCIDDGQYVEYDQDLFQIQKI
ncbi:MAG: acetyl-CoA carboxylase biotin carboxyl carrier protein, partial [Actinomycetia bacterium]|nr:acetyl-CoA carboxylase biotin carboxyl carrier protein [Actinomycetes bacterium]